MNDVSKGAHAVLAWVCMFIAGVLCAMPTAKELAAARPVVAELTDGMDAAAVAELVGQAETEASRYLLTLRTAELHIKAKAYGAAAATLETLYTSIADMAPATVVAEIQRLARGVAEKDAPRLLALLKLSRALDVARKDKKTDARTMAELHAAVGQWDAALALFASQKGKVAEVAEKETELKDLVGVADFWWAYEPATAAAGDAFRRHAVKLYQAALDDGTITAPLKVALVKKRMEQMKAVDVPDSVIADLPTRPVLASPDKLYLVVDLSSGPKSKKYKVSYLSAEPKGGWTDKYKTDRLVMRRIEPGSYIMGDDQKDESHRVTITKPFYIGVFEVTQRQWELVKGNRPSFWQGTCWMTRPVENVSHNAVRGKDKGAKWPASNEVDDASFLGLLRARTKLVFDLPTEGQWEYACRAGTTSDYNAEGGLDKLGRWSGNGGWNTVWGEYHWSTVWQRADRKCDAVNGTAPAGSYRPNAWGLYDLHGNVNEWCLDWKPDHRAYGFDPVGSVSGDGRVMRGGSWNFGARECRSAFGCGGPTDNVMSALGDYGFRLALPLEK